MLKRKLTGYEGNVLRTWRDESALSVKVAADKLGISTSYLYRIENSSSPPPVAFFLHKFLKLYKRQASTYDDTTHKVKQEVVIRGKNFRKTYTKTVGQRRQRIELSPEAIALRDLRIEAGLSQSQANEQLGYSANGRYICLVENGREDPPTDQALMALLEGYGVKRYIFEQLARKYKVKTQEVHQKNISKISVLAEKLSFNEAVFTLKQIEKFSP